MLTAGESPWSPAKCLLLSLVNFGTKVQLPFLRDPRSFPRPRPPRPGRRPPPPRVAEVPLKHENVHKGEEDLGCQTYQAGRDIERPDLLLLSPPPVVLPQEGETAGVVPAVPPAGDCRPPPVVCRHVQAEGGLNLCLADRVDVEVSHCGEVKPCGHLHSLHDLTTCHLLGLVTI